MFFVLSKILDLLLTPLAWGLILVAFALPFRTKRPRRPKRDRALGLSGIGLILFFALAPVGNRIIWYLESSAKDTTRDGETYDAVVLLGGMVEDDATAAHQTTAYNEHIERLLVTFDLLRTGRAKSVIVSGGPSTIDKNVVEAERLRDQLVSWGIAPERIVVEPRAMNTRDNAVYVAELAKERGFVSLVIVTSAFHMARAEGCFRAIGVSVDTLPADFSAYDPSVVTGSFLPRSSHLETSTRGIRELFGRLVYRVMGYSKPA